MNQSDFLRRREQEAEKRVFDDAYRRERILARMIAEEMIKALREGGYISQSSNDDKKKEE